ncbi:MAG TPA: peptidoglycan editing factor PgeF [Gammaproteobacteria bacterium]
MIELIEPLWTAPPAVRSAFTTRGGGFSEPPYAGFNLGLHVGDDPARVARNRALLRSTLDLPAEPSWIAQTHGTRAVVLEAETRRDADAAITRVPGQVAVVMVADCLPILLCNRDGSEVAAVHAGWRGLQAGVVASTLGRMRSSAAQLLAWIGPGISRDNFEVGDEVLEAFGESFDGARDFFEAHGEGHWMCDLGGLAERELERLGVTEIWRDPRCSYGGARQFYSYRRDRVTGRMAALIWID